VLLILMLKKLTQLSKLSGTFGTLIRKVRNAAIPVAIISQLRNFRHVSRHGPFGFGKLVNLLSYVVSSSTARTKAALNMLNSVCSRPETNFSTHGTSHVSRSVYLHMHVKIILVVKSAVTDAALERGYVCGLVDAISATRVAVAFVPLVPTEPATRSVVSTISAVSSHFQSSNLCQ
jgi:hypothetical protein